MLFALIWATLVHEELEVQLLILRAQVDKVLGAL